MGVYFSISSLLFILIIGIVFILKDKIKTDETRLYKRILIVTILGLLLEISSAYLFKMGYDYNSGLFRMYAKITASYYTIWSYFFVSYMMCICNVNKTKWYALTFVSIILYFTLLSLPIEFIHNGDTIVPIGFSIYLTYLMCIIYTIFDIIIYIKYHKVINAARFSSLYAFIGFGTASLIISVMFPQLFVMGYALSLIVVIMYFTIENPDVKMLEEFKIAKNRAEKANEEKEIFLYDMTQNIRVPLNEIKRASLWLDSNYKDITEQDIRDGSRYINNKATSILDRVNNVLDITNMELTNIKVYQSKYDIGNVISHIKKTYKEIENVKLIYSIDSNIPKELYGDSLRLKQLITILMDNAIKYTDEGYVELKLNTIVKKDVCRLIITVEDTGCGIKASEIDNIFNKENQLYNNLDKIDDSKKNLAIAKSIASLLGGILLLDSEIGKGTKITLVLDQTIYKEKSSELNKLEEDAEKYIDKKKVMIVVEDEDYMAKVKKKLSKYDIILEPIEKGSKCIEKIRLKHKYDLIIMDEILRDLSSLEVLKRLKKVTNFKTPVCLLTDDTENENFLDEGFSYLLDKKLSKKDLDKLMREIV